MNLDLVSLMTNDIDKMKRFYSDLLGFEVIDDYGQYVEMKSETVRFAICHNDVMYKETENQSYKSKKTGQRLELAFIVKDRAQVDEWFKKFRDNNVEIIKSPHVTPWGLYTGIFSDPEGNIHEIFCRE